MRAFCNVVYATNQGIDPYIATGRRKHDEPKPTVRGRAPKDLTLKEKMARKLVTKAGAAVYARRKVIVEPVLGQIKQARGFRQFLLRGLAKVRGEWALTRGAGIDLNRYLFRSTKQPARDGLCGTATPNLPPQ